MAEEPYGLQSVAKSWTKVKQQHQGFFKLQEFLPETYLHISRTAPPLLPAKVETQLSYSGCLGAGKKNT